MADVTSIFYPSLFSGSVCKWRTISNKLFLGQKNIACFFLYESDLPTQFQPIELLCSMSVISSKYDIWLLYHPATPSSILSATMKTHTFMCALYGLHLWPLTNSKESHNILIASSGYRDFCSPDVTQVISDSRTHLFLDSCEIVFPKIVFSL